ncbi:hypothetical protein CY0110_10657 [Crocosphaera chwakensis CCY0110]|uniref:Uncharacterized protein n=1 Tax=Crocosphaera chwakensis CCY0110 TaxID=391612 RepID=A3IH88_9CHRO|nr:hypothetical protein CY0110_10657 [Crocosphaera chwakensis CCY0110]
MIGLGNIVLRKRQEAKGKKQKLVNQQVACLGCKGAGNRGDYLKYF